MMRFQQIFDQVTQTSDLARLLLLADLHFLFKTDVLVFDIFKISDPIFALFKGQNVANCTQNRLWAPFQFSKCFKTREK